MGREGWVGRGRECNGALSTIVLLRPLCCEEELPLVDVEPSVERVGVSEVRAPLKRFARSRARTQT